MVHATLKDMWCGIEHFQIWPKILFFFIFERNSLITFIEEEFLRPDLKRRHSYLVPQQTYSHAVTSIHAHINWGENWLRRQIQIFCLICLHNKSKKWGQEYIFLKIAEINISPRKNIAKTIKKQPLSCQVFSLLKVRLNMTYINSNKNQNN